MAKKSKRKAAFGDFQTPFALAKQALQKALTVEPTPSCLVEPTCGKGSFLCAASTLLTPPCRLLGYELNQSYLQEAKGALEANAKAGIEFQLHHRNFFAVEWDLVLAQLPEPLIVIGNPPWVTNSELGQLDVRNLPEKSNFQKHLGIEAITGKSNFDISEWMSVSLLKALAHKRATFAFLLKTAVARKLLAYAWKHRLPLEQASLFPIDARAHFDATVHACLFVCKTDSSEAPRCAVFDDLHATKATKSIGYSEGRLVANVDTLPQAEALLVSPSEEAQEWRSGIKHDCAKILEFRRKDDTLVNNLGEEIQVEEELLFPLLKSSDVAKNQPEATRWLLVTQTQTGSDTQNLSHRAPKAWNYLCKHRKLFERRKSNIYKHRPAFSIFGVGPYTFAPWKVAISGLYKNLHFTVVPPINEKPVVFDDTVYFTPCQTEAEARLKAQLLNSALAKTFFSTYVFLDAKRPITAQLLRKLSLTKLAKALGKLDELKLCLPDG